MQRVAGLRAAYTGHAIDEIGLGLVEAAGLGSEIGRVHVEVDSPRHMPGGKLGDRAYVEHHDVAAQAELLKCGRLDPFEALGRGKNILRVLDGLKGFVW